MASLPEYPAKGDRQRLDQEWLRALNRQGVSTFFDEEPRTPAGLFRAIGEFNQGQYWSCHETLEALWLPERYPLRLFYHGLIKAAVGLLHFQRRNRHGALVKLDDAVCTLAPFSPRFLGIDIASLIEAVEHRLECLQSSRDVNWPVVENLPAVQLQVRERAC
jgi:hypothetical protein